MFRVDVPQIRPTFQPQSTLMNVLQGAAQGFGTYENLRKQHIAEALAQQQAAAQRQTALSKLMEAGAQQDYIKQQAQKLQFERSPLGIRLALAGHPDTIAGSFLQDYLAKTMPLQIPGQQPAAAVATTPQQAPMGTPQAGLAPPSVAHLGPQMSIGPMSTAGGLSDILHRALTPPSQQTQPTAAMTAMQQPGQAVQPSIQIAPEPGSPAAELQVGQRIRDAFQQKQEAAQQKAEQARLGWPEITKQRTDFTKTANDMRNLKNAATSILHLLQGAPDGQIGGNIGSLVGGPKARRINTLYKQIQAIGARGGKGIRNYPEFKVFSQQWGDPTLPNQAKLEALVGLIQRSDSVISYDNQIDAMEAKGIPSQVDYAALVRKAAGGSVLKEPKFVYLTSATGKRLRVPIGEGYNVINEGGSTYAGYE